MSQGQEARTSPLLCTHRDSRQAGAQEVHIRQVNFYVVVGTVCSSSSIDGTLKIEVILSLLQGSQNFMQQVAEETFYPRTLKFSHVTRGILSAL